MAKRLICGDGGRRLRAALLCGIPTLKAIVVKGRPSPVELLKMQAGIDFHHLRLSWGERIDLAARLQEKTGCTVNELASMLNISQPMATKLCRARRVAPEVRRALDEGRIDIEKLYIIGSEADHGKQIELLHGADGMTRETLRKRARSNRDPSNIRTSLARFPLSKGGITVTVQGPRVTLLAAIQALTDVTKELKRGQAEHFDISAVARAMANRCQTNS